MTRVLTILIIALTLCGPMSAPGVWAQTGDNPETSTPEPPLEEVLVGPAPSAPAEQPSPKQAPPAAMGLEAEPEEPATAKTPETPAPEKQTPKTTPEAPKKQADTKKSPEKQPLWVKMRYIHGILEDYEGVKLSYPSKLFVDYVKGEIYVTDSGNSRIVVYTSDFYPLLTIGKADGIESPAGLAVDPRGALFIAQPPGKNNPRSRITLLSPALTFKKNIYFTGFDGAAQFQPINIAINPEGLLYVTGSGYAGAVVLNKDGTFSHLLCPTDSFGKKEEEKAVLCDVEIDEAGRIYLLSEEMGRIYVYDHDEKFLFKFGQKGGGSGKLSRPRGMGLDNRNRMIYVVDYMRHSAGAYSMDDGSFLFEFGGKGWRRGWFQFPSDIGVDVNGNVLVADTFNDRVQVLGVKTR